MYNLSGGLKWKLVLTAEGSSGFTGMLYMTKGKGTQNLFVLDVDVLSQLSPDIPARRTKKPPMPVVLFFPGRIPAVNYFISPSNPQYFINLFLLKLVSFQANTCAR